jgi:hypothetical protein
MDVSFNELSLKKAENPAIAKQWMMNLLTVYKSANLKGFKGLRLPRTEAAFKLPEAKSYWRISLIGYPALEELDSLARK